jgi:hypothetical protein
MSQTKSFEDSKTFGDSKSFGCIPFVSGWLRRKHEKKKAIFRDMLQKQTENVKKYMDNHYKNVLHYVKDIKIYENLICIFVKEGELICSIDNSKYFEFLCDMLHDHINTLKQSANEEYEKMIIYNNTCKTHELYKYIKHDLEKIYYFTKLKIENLIKNVDIYDWHYHFYKWSNKTDTGRIVKPINSDYFINPININKYRTLLKLVCFQIIKLMKFDDTKYGVNKNIKHVRDAKIKCYDVGEIIDKYKYLRNINEMIFKSIGTNSSVSVYIQSFDKNYIDHLIQEFYSYIGVDDRLIAMYYIILYIESNNENTLINLMKFSYICEKFKYDDPERRQSEYYSSQKYPY